MVMTSSRRRRGVLPAVVFLLLLVSGEAAFAQRAKGSKGPPKAPAEAAIPETVEWRAGTYADLLREAADRNVPLLVSFLPQEPSLHARVRLGLYRSSDFREVAAQCIGVVAMDARHPTEGADPATAPCPFFPTLRCADHVEMARAVFPLFAVDGALRPPVHFLVEPGGKLHKRVENSSLQDAEAERDRLIVRAARETVKAVGLGLTLEEYRSLLERLRLADAALGDDEVEKAWGLLEEVRREVERGALLERIASREEEVLRRVGEMLDIAGEQIAGGEIGSAYETYRRMEAAFAKTPAGARARKERTRLERDPKTKDLVRAHKLAAEAEDLLRKAEALEAEGDAARALRIYETLLERYADTPAAENARIRVKTLRGKTGSPPAGGGAPLTGRRGR